MEPIRKVLSDVMRSLGAYLDYDPKEREIVERWLSGIFIAAAVRKADEVIIRPSPDHTTLVPLIFGGDDCRADRLHPLEFEYEKALEALVSALTGHIRFERSLRNPFFGRFEESVGDIRFMVDVFIERVQNNEQIRLVLRYVTH